MKLAIVFAFAAACVVAPPPQQPARPEPVAYYIAAILPGPGALARIRRCAVDASGQPTGYCYYDYVGANSEDALIARQAMKSGPALPAEPRPPRSVTVAAPVKWPGVRRELVAAMEVANDRQTRSLIASCQRQFGTKQLDLVRYGVDVSAAGDVEQVHVRGDVESFVASCTADAVRHMQFPAAGAQHYELATRL
ncbi:MAG TPA: hypothetical protein VMJ10_01740 [Kofleriaceae bacterium]|nr:hypothetical protein [Kofleriaceae bacterium]